MPLAEAYLQGVRARFTFVSSRSGLRAIWFTESKLEVDVGSITVRPARATDQDAVWALVRRFAVSFTPSYDRFCEAFAEAMNEADMLAAVAVDTSAVVGYVLANRHPTFFADGPVVWVEEVMVDATSRRAGVGRALMLAVEKWARDSGAQYVSLATRRATDFYLAIGYDESAVFFRRLLG